MYAEFSENLITGNALIDAQHQELINKINDFLKTCETSKELASAVHTLDYLADYTQFHFKEEENLQKSVEYPGLAEHLKQHRDFEQALQDLYDMLREEEGPSPAFVKAVEKNVVDWLYRHIDGFDRSVAEYIQMNNNSERL